VSECQDSVEELQKFSSGEGWVVLTLKLRVQEIWDSGKCWIQLISVLY